MSRILKKALSYLMVFTLLLTAASCGLRDNPEPVLDETDESSTTKSADAGVETDEVPATRAVADFHYVKMPYALTEGYQNRYGYALNGEWFYYMENKSIMENESIEERVHFKEYISRVRISDGYQERYYMTTSGMREAKTQKVFLVDGEGNCYLFWHAYKAEEREIEFADTLEKYGPDGALLYRVDYTTEDLSGMGEMLDQGTVTEDGRVFLCSYGEGGTVFAFGTDGKLEETYTPQLEKLEGVAVGKNGRAYGYSVTAKEKRFQELGGEGKVYECPMVPLQVYDGYERGICLRTKGGMWSYVPETGETVQLWKWEDEYIQLKGDYVELFYSGGRECMMMCFEQQETGLSPNDSLMHHRRQVLTFARVTEEDGREYPGKQVLRLAVGDGDDIWLEMAVKRYNRRSREYHVKMYEESDSSDLEMKLVRETGPDLVNIADIYAEHLAELGAFEDLAPYYEASGSVSESDILESVRKACTLKGREVAVIPAFSIGSLEAREVWFAPEEWTVDKFLELGRENRMFGIQDTDTALRYCMGIRYGERFIDWEKRECHFDSDEFRRVLEGCSAWKTHKVANGGFQDGDCEWLFETEQWTQIGSVWDMVSDKDPGRSAKLVGLPGWEGGEYELKDYGMFAINSASENKEGAWDFLEYLLSEENQSLVDWAFPVRKESFETCLKDLYTDPSLLNVYDTVEGYYDQAVPDQKDIENLRNMVDSAVHDSWGGRNNPIWNIVSYEAKMYFAGNATLDDTVAKIQNRIQLYLQEQ